MGLQRLTAIKPVAIAFLLAFFLFSVVPSAAATLFDGLFGGDAGIVTEKTINVLDGVDRRKLSEEDDAKCLSRYNISGILDSALKAIDCRVEGESLADNPEYCTAFRNSPEGEPYSGISSKTPCCHTGRYLSNIPTHLKGIVTIGTNDLIYIKLNQKTRSKNVLIPLLGPHRDRIDFAVNQIDDGAKCADLCNEYHPRAHTLSLISQTMVTFSYSRTAGFNPIVKPDVSTDMNDFQGTRCPLCRNSLAVPPAKVYGKLEFAEFPNWQAASNFTVQPSKNTIVRHMLATKTNTRAEMLMPGGACSNGEKGFRPWRWGNGTTLGYYVPFRLLRPERVSGHRPNAKDETQMFFNATEGHYQLGADSACEITLIFYPPYQLLVN